MSGLLFFIFINDIVNCSRELFFNLFADDTCVYLKNRNLPDLYRNMNLELGKLGDWLAANKLALNIEKTVYLLFKGKKRMADLPNLYIYQTPITRKECTKFLGIFIDQNLSWKPHVQFLLGKISRSIGIFRKIQENLNLSSLKTLYFSFIQPSLQYGIIFWFHVSKDLQEKLFRLQKKAVRIISRSPFFSHTDPLFSSKQTKFLNFRTCIN